MARERGSDEANGARVPESGDKNGYLMDIR